MATNPVTFIKQARTELGKVKWPSRQETFKLTMVVIGVSVVVGLYIGGLDIFLTWLTQTIIKR